LKERRKPLSSPKRFDSILDDILKRCCSGNNNNKRAALLLKNEQPSKTLARAGSTALPTLSRRIQTPYDYVFTTTTTMYKVSLQKEREREALEKSRKSLFSLSLWRGGPFFFFSLKPYSCI